MEIVAMWLLEKIPLAIELIVFVAILRELLALRKHERALEEHQVKVVAELEELGKMQAALQQHEEHIISEVAQLRSMNTALEKHEKQLDAARPIFSTLYTTPEEIMELSISFTEEAKEIYALGSIRSLMDTERAPDETQMAFEERVGQVNPRIREFIAATEKSILSGCSYCRIIDFRPIDASEDAVLEVLSNINFFRRLMNFRGTHPHMHLEVYHSSEIVRARGDYHFRCNDQRVELRIGGHGNTSANAAIVITDARVVTQYKQYFISLTESDLARLITLDDLVQINDLLVARDIEGLEKYLAA
jgi:hypothetical protein